MSGEVMISGEAGGGGGGGGLDAKSAPTGFGSGSHAGMGVA